MLRCSPLSWIPLTILLQTVSAATSSQYLQVPFSDEYVGPDGPWWGVSIALGISELFDRPVQHWVGHPYPGAYSQAINNTLTVYDLNGTSANNYFGPTFLFNFSTIGIIPLRDDWNPGFETTRDVAFRSADWFTTSYDGWGNISNITGDFPRASLVNIPLWTDPGDGVQSQKNASARFNTSMVVWQDSAVFSIRNGTQYNPSVPLFGLGGTSQGSADNNAPLGATAQVKKGGAIGSEFFALHVGSVNPNISPSLYLGGYDPARAYGKVGVFGWQPLRDMVTDTYYPQVPLVDVRLGTQTGGSPFNFTDQSRSLWHFANISQSAAQISQEAGGPQNSTLVFPNSAEAYLRLPEGLCGAIASYLPVEYNSDFGYWLWKTSDPSFSKLVKSPAYLEFVMQDVSRTNISIKVPFQLLNLTLEAPLNNGSSLQYFPCTEPERFDAEEGYQPFYILGRAFLQAAYFAVNYEQNTTFLAQAPGPGFDSSKRNIIEANSTLSNMSSSDIGQWAQTWSSSWTPLPGSTTGGSSDTSGSSSNSGSDSQSQSSANSTRIGLGVGLGIGLPALIAAGIAGLFFYRRRQRLRNEYSKTGRQVAITDPSPPAYEDHSGREKSAAVTGAHGNHQSAQHDVQEIDGQTTVQEIDGRASMVPVMPPAEMADTSEAGLVSELPADFAYHDDPHATAGVSRGHSRRISEMNSSTGALSPNTVTGTAPGSPGMVSLMSPQLSPSIVGRTSSRPASEQGSVVSRDHERD